MGTFHVSLDIGGPAGDRYESTIVLFGDEPSESLMGSYTLEGFGLAVDPINRRLVAHRTVPDGGYVPSQDQELRSGGDAMWEKVARPEEVRFWRGRHTHPSPVYPRSCRRAFF